MQRYLLATALYLVAAWQSCYATDYCDISKRDYNVTITDAAVIGSQRQASSNSTSTSRRYVAFTFGAYKKTTYPQNFGFHIDYINGYYGSVSFELTQYGSNCSASGWRNKTLLSSSDFTWHAAQVWYFATDQHCTQLLSIYQKNVSGAYYTTQMVLTPQWPCNRSAVYKCSSTECVDGGLMCDGFKNCRNGVDENSWCSPPNWWLTTPMPMTNNTTESDYYSNWYFYLFYGRLIFWSVGLAIFVLVTIGITIYLCKMNCPKKSRANVTCPAPATSSPTVIVVTSPKQCDDSLPPAYDAIPMKHVDY